jgi:hypothetical protein
MPAPAEATRPRLFTMAMTTRKEIFVKRSCRAMGHPNFKNAPTEAR